MNVETLLDEIIRREGGFVNDPDDPGGATKYGITIGTLSKHRGRRQSVSDVRELSKSEARQIYVQRYLNQPRINELPQALVASVFDMYVNAGSHAVRILQRTLNEFGETLTVDGVIGNKTIMSAELVYRIAERYLVDAYGIERRRYYYSLAEARPASRKYAKTRAGAKGGWIKRAEEFISRRYWLSPDAHKAKTSHW